MRLNADFSLVESATLAGRWALADALEAAPYAGICVGTMNYNRLRQLGELSSDIRSIADAPAPDVPCDAISFAMGFDGSRAHFGGVSDLFGVPNRCAAIADAGLDAGP